LCGLDGQQLVVLSECAESHHRGEQGGKRDGQREQCRAPPSQEFKYDLETEPFAYKFIDVQPQELHHQYENDHQKDRQERSNERFQYESVQ